MEKKKKQKTMENEKIIPRKRPEVTKGSTTLIKTGCGNLYITINEDENRQLFEIFASMGKAGGCAASQTEAIGRLISLALRSNIEPTKIIKQLKGISCHLPNEKALSCSDAIARLIEIYLEESLTKDTPEFKDSQKAYHL